MMRGSRYVLGSVIALSVVAPAGPACSWNDRAHRDMSERAAKESNMPSYLRQQLRLEGALDETFPRTGVFGFVRRQTVLTLISDGAVDEDSPLVPPRVRHHFHNPTVTWDKAALTGFGGQSAVRWAQDPNQDQNDGGGKHSWQDARARLLRALTATKESDRKIAFGELFQTLGHQIHLIQDQANPAHTRNDLHPAYPFGKAIIGDPDRFHFWAEEDENRNSVFRDPAGRPLPSLGPDSSVLARGANDLAPIPIARLIDTERYRPLYQSNTAFPPAGLDIGMAEYASAHFFSDDTAFKGLDIPSAATTTIDNGTLDPRTGRTRWYVLSRSATPDTDPRVAIATLSSLHTELPDALKTSKLKLNSRVFTDTGRLLFPRAVGYSIAALNYFFRGRLDVNVEFEPLDANTGTRDPEIRQLFGVNASEDTLGPGTITIYAEDPSTRERAQVSSATSPTDELGEVAIGPTEKDGPIVDAGGLPIRFRPPFRTERYVVVFTGTLGNEKPADQFVGAVVGTVIGGERPEGVVSGDKPVLRTPHGTFNLPRDADGLDRAQWGDRDNTFVGVVALDPDNVRPDIVKAFRIGRPEGSTDVPALTQDDGTDVAIVETLKSVNFPFGVSLNTMVDWSHTAHFDQALITYELKQTHVFHSTGDNGEGFYELVSTDIGTPDLERPAAAEVVFSRSFPLILDEAHLLGQTGVQPRPYGWRVNDVGLDAQNRLLAVVEVKFTSFEPGFTLRRVPTRSRNTDCEMQARGAYLLGASIPIINIVTVLLDVETGQVLGTTGTGSIAPVTVAHEMTTTLQMKLTSVFEGGFRAGTETNCLDANFRVPNDDYATENRATLALPPLGVSGQEIAGWYRGDVAALVETTPQIEPFSGEDRQVYFVDGDAKVNHAVTLGVNGFRSVGYRTHVREGMRIRPATTPNPQVLVRFARPVGIGAGGEEAVLLQWSPVNPAESRLAYPDELPPSMYTLKRATPQSAMLLSEDPAGGGVAASLLVEFNPANVRRYAGRDLSREFVLMAPELLYNVNDTQFYTLDLAQTALPLPLEQGPTGPQPFADFHVIVVSP